MKSIYKFSSNGEILENLSNIKNVMTLKNIWLHQQPPGTRVAVYCDLDPFASNAWKVIRCKNGKTRIVQDYNAPINPCKF